MHWKTASLALAGIIPAIVLFAPHAAAQAVVRGVVRDSTSLEPVAYALVTIDARGAGPVREAVTDLYGAFVVANVAAAEPTLMRVEALGYSAWELEYGSGDLPADGLRVLLVGAQIELEGIEVAGRRVGDPLSVGTGIYMMDAELVRAQPVVLETDVLRATVLSPSASASSDWVSVPFIRDGRPRGERDGRSAGGRVHWRCGHGGPVRRAIARSRRPEDMAVGVARPSGSHLDPRRGTGDGQLLRLRPPGSRQAGPGSTQHGAVRRMGGAGPRAGSRRRGAGRAADRAFSAATGGRG